MKNVMKYLVWFGVILASVFFGAAAAGAHGTAYRVLDDARAVTAEFNYADGEPMQYAEVLVFSPLDEKVEYQNGRTDRRGRFAFYPDTAGTWHIEVQDGMGHLARGVIEVAPDATEQADSVHPNKDTQAMVSGPTSKSGKIALGLSLMFNVGAIAYLWKNRTAMKKRDGR
jgi:nickel transport protein